MGYIQSVACRVVHAVEFSAICFLQSIQNLEHQLATLHREQEERKAAEVAEEESKAMGVGKGEEERVSLAIWKATCLVCKQQSFHTEETRHGSWPVRRDGRREGEGSGEVEGEWEGEVEGGEVEGKLHVHCTSSIILSSKNQKWSQEVIRNRLISSTPIYGPLIIIRLAI